MKLILYTLCLEFAGNNAYGTLWRYQNVIFFNPSLRVATIDTYPIQHSEFKKNAHIHVVIHDSQLFIPVWGSGIFQNTVF